MIDELQERAELRGMPLDDYLRWRATLRADYKQALAPVEYDRLTALESGILFVALDPPAQLYERLTFVSELPDPEKGTWAEWASMPLSWRTREAA